jgi:hypothetical protein
MKFDYSQQIFEKYSDIKFRENPSSGSLVVPCGQAKGQTDRHDKANSRFSQFCARASRPLFDLYFIPALHLCT